MKVESTKNQRLMRQYPFVEAILFLPMEPFGGDDGKRIDDLTIRVEKADADLMFRRANNTGLGDHSFCFNLQGNRKGQVMRRGEYAFAVGKKGWVLNQLNFPRNDDERREEFGEIYAWTVMWGARELNASSTGFLYTDNLEDKTKYIVWVTVEAWHEDTENDDAPGSRFGQFIDRIVRVTIYGEPDEGFSELHKNASVYENLRLDTHLMTRGALDKNHDIVSMGGMLYEMCITFQDEVYFNGMKDILDKGKYRGASGEFGPVKVLAAEMCGYDRVMIEDSMSYVTFQLRPESRHMYVLGQQGTLPQIRNLVRTVVRMWNQNPEVRTTFKTDKDVSVM